MAEAREHTRFHPPSSRTTLTLADGSMHGCFIIDLSLGGVAVSAEIQPPVGTPLAIGGCVGRVIRVFHNGFAVRFVETHRLSDLTRLISREFGAGRASQPSEVEEIPA